MENKFKQYLEFVIEKTNIKTILVKIGVFICFGIYHLILFNDIILENLMCENISYFNLIVDFIFSTICIIIGFNLIDYHSYIINKKK